MKKRVEFIEHTTGYVEIEVPDGMSTGEIEDKVIDTINDGNAVYCDTTHDIKTEDYCDLDFEELFARALTHAMEYENIDNAMDSMDITQPDVRAKVKKWFHCDNDYPGSELPESVNTTIDEIGYEDGDDLDEKIADYLSDQYGYCVNGFCIESTDMTTGDIRVTEINWDTED